MLLLQQGMDEETSTLIIVILLVAILFGPKIVKELYACIFYFRVPFDIPATIDTFSKEGVAHYGDDEFCDPLDICETLSIDELINLEQHYAYETPELIFEKGYQFENKLDGKMYDFPFYNEKFPFNKKKFSKYGKGAKIVCRFYITINRLTKKVVKWELRATKCIQPGDKNYKLMNE